MAFIIFAMLGIFQLTKDPAFRSYVETGKSFASQIMLRATKLVKTLPNNSTVAIYQLSCTYSKNITVYMDAFKEVSSVFFGKEYKKFMDKSRQCGLFPGGGQCLFNNNNKSSDAIFYYGGYTKLKFSRVFDGQIVVVSTKEAENGHYCSFPSPDKYDIKVSYSRQSNVTWAYFVIGFHS